MLKPTFIQCLSDFMRSLDESGIGRPVSIELPGREEALAIVREIKSPSKPAESKILLGESQGFLLFGIEFWWRLDSPTVAPKQDLEQ